MSFLREVEKVIKLQSSTYLKQLEFYHGIDLRAYKVLKNKMSRVYGRESGEIDDSFTEFTGIVVNNDVIPIDDIHAGSFTNGMLYTTSQIKMEPGMVIEIPNDDTTRIRRFEILEKQAFGQTTSIFYQYTLTSLGGD